MRIFLTTLVFIMSPLAIYADEPALKLELVNTKANYPWPHDMKPEAYEAKIKEIEKQLKQNKPVDAPPAPAVDMAIKFTNTTNAAITVHMKGDPNIMSLELTGPSVAVVNPLKAMTLEFRLPQPVTIEAGKSIEFPIKSLMDGMRGVSRHWYFLKPGEYTLSASYQLTDMEGNKTGLLKSAAIKFTVDEPK